MILYKYSGRVIEKYLRKRNRHNWLRTLGVRSSEAHGKVRLNPGRNSANFYIGKIRSSMVRQKKRTIKSYGSAVSVVICHAGFAKYVHGDFRAKRCSCLTSISLHLLCVVLKSYILIGKQFS